MIGLNYHCDSKTVCEEYRADVPVKHDQAQTATNHCKSQKGMQNLPKRLEEILEHLRHEPPAVTVRDAFDLFRIADIVVQQLGYEGSRDMNFIRDVLRTFGIEESKAADEAGQIPRLRAWNHTSPQDAGSSATTMLPQKE